MKRKGLASVGRVRASRFEDAVASGHIEYTSKKPVLDAVSTGWGIKDPVLLRPRSVWRSAFSASPLRLVRQPAFRLRHRERTSRENRTERKCGGGGGGETPLSVGERAPLCPSSCFSKVPQKKGKGEMLRSVSSCAKSSRPRITNPGRVHGGEAKRRWFF